MLKRLKKIIFKVIFFVIIFLFIIVLINILHSNKNESEIEIELPEKELSVNEQLIGNWTTDGITIYMFNENNTGILKLPLSEYSFKYILKNNDVYIDFENENSVDSSYTISFEENKMFLKGINQTTGNFILTKF